MLENVYEGLNAEGYSTPLVPGDKDGHEDDDCDKSQIPGIIQNCIKP